MILEPTTLGILFGLLALWLLTRDHNDHDDWDK